MTLITVILSWSYFENHSCLFRLLSCSSVVILCVCASGFVSCGKPCGLLAWRNQLHWKLMVAFFYTNNDILQCVRLGMSRLKLIITMSRNARNWVFLTVKTVVKVQGSGWKLYLHSHVVLLASCVIFPGVFFFLSLDDSYVHLSYGWEEFEVGTLINTSPVQSISGPKLRLSEGGRKVFMFGGFPNDTIIQGHRLFFLSQQVF